MNLFIDTNIFLSFYHFTSDDLEELKKLVECLRASDITLYLPTQVVHEFRRNRTLKIEDAFKNLSAKPCNYPQICRDYDEYHQLRDLQRKLSHAHDQLLQKVHHDIRANTLSADAIVREIFELAQSIPVDHTLIFHARNRAEIGNPPGKKGSLGDAVNWECLLQAVPEGEDIHFVASDKDYYSVLYKNEFKQFLNEEWEQNKGSDLYCYRQLSDFFKAYYPNIQLRNEIEKDRLIGLLATSGSFSQTHAIVGKLLTYSEFSDEQANNIVCAAITNPQVSWIIQDEDVHTLTLNVLASHRERIDPESLRDINELLNPESSPDETEDEEEVEIPF